MMPNLTTDQLAEATASAFRIVLEALIASGVDPQYLADRVEAKANDYVVNQRKSNVGNLLRVFLEPE
jgi:hypothetical protein